MCDKTGCCGSFSRCLLVFVNVVSFISNSIWLLGAISIKNGYDFINQFFKIQEINEFLKQIEPYIITLIIYITFLVIVSIFGFSIGCCVNRVALIAYACINGAHLVFLLIMFLVTIFSSPDDRIFMFNPKYFINFKTILNFFGILGFMMVIDVLVAFILGIIILFSMNKRKNMVYMRPWYIRTNQL